MTRTKHVTPTGHTLHALLCDLSWTVFAELDGVMMLINGGLVDDAETARLQAQEFCQQIDYQEAVLMAALKEFTGQPMTSATKAAIDRKLRPLMLIMRQLTPEETDR
jgi:hypothetical protein